MRYSRGRPARRTARVLAAAVGQEETRRFPHSGFASGILLASPPPIPSHGLAPHTFLVRLHHEHKLLLLVVGIIGILGSLDVLLMYGIAHFNKAFAARISLLSRR